MTTFASRGLVALSAVLILTGCEPVRHYRRLTVACYTGPVQKYPTPPKKPYGSVKVFQTKEDVAEKYEALGMMTCEGEAEEEAAIVNAMLYRAADMGADGLILTPPGTGGETATNVRLSWGLMPNNSHRAFRAEAIKFVKPADVTK
jgi:hypothetical protein